jgi:hypothetical protein
VAGDPIIGVSGIIVSALVVINFISSELASRPASRNEVEISGTEWSSVSTQLQWDLPLIQYEISFSPPKFVIYQLGGLDSLAIWRTLGSRSPV